MYAWGRDGYKPGCPHEPQAHLLAEAAPVKTSTMYPASGSDGAVDTSLINLPTPPHPHLNSDRYKKSDNSFYVFADDTVPRSITAALNLDYDTMAGADRFGNLHISRLPPELSAQVPAWLQAGGTKQGGEGTSQPSGCRLLFPDLARHHTWQCGGCVGLHLPSIQPLHHSSGGGGPHGRQVCGAERGAGRRFQQAGLHHQFPCEAVGVK